MEHVFLFMILHMKEKKYEMSIEENHPVERSFQNLHWMLKLTKIMRLIPRLGMDIKLNIL